MARDPLADVSLTRSDEDIRIDSTYVVPSIDPPETDVVIIRVRKSLVAVCLFSKLFISVHSIHSRKNESVHIVS